ncbi:MAG: S-methyl-5'-thioadenosine phosphorylase [Deltaproteobacteria bacterium]|nr:S-methyl-5'-thioadenosine phosphorylase [Deltaproteobacteria bacterium]
MTGDARRWGVIGGSGLYGMEGLEDVREVEVETPYGVPSDKLTVGRMGDHELVFVPRHGRGHRHSPSEVPYRANLFALKSLGVSRIFSVSAVGSMKEDIALGVPVIVDQFIDRTHARKSTFFEDGIVAHVSMADPVCPGLRGLLLEAAARTGIDVVDGGTYVCMEGPQFSSRGESLMYRSIGVDVIGMTNATEAKLAREAEICYATIALPTDFDCWHDGHDDVSVGSVLEILGRGTERARGLIRSVLDHDVADSDCGCDGALEGAIMTDRGLVSDETRCRLGPLVDRYLD